MRLEDANLRLAVARRDAESRQAGCREPNCFACDSNRAALNELVAAAIAVGRVESTQPQIDRRLVAEDEASIARGERDIALAEAERLQKALGKMIHCESLQEVLNVMQDALAKCIP